jgi:sentrin-specific protease 7
MDGSAAERTSAGSAKRVRDASEQKSPNNKKQKMHNTDEGRLTGNNTNGVPKDRKVIETPTTFNRMNKDETSTEAKKSQANPVRSKPGSSYQHRTLNNIHANQPGRVGKSYPVYKPPFAKSTVAPKSTRAVARGAALDNDIGDGFSASPSKRRKTNGAPKTSNEQDPVELSDSDDDVREVNGVHAVNGQSVSSNSNSAPIELDSQSQSQSNDYFSAREQRSINQRLVSGPHSKRRRKSSGQNTPSVSSFSPKEHRDTAHSMSGSHADPGGTGDPAKSHHPNQMKSSAKMGVNNNNKLPHPSTTLGEGVDDDFGAAGMQRRKDDHSLRKMNESLNHLSGKSIKSVLVKEERSDNRAAEQETPRQPHSTRVPNSAEGEQSLRRQFKRDADTTPQQQPNHQQRERRQSLASKMQVTSNTGEANTVQESPDQLHGGNTMIRRRQAQQAPSRTVAVSHAHRRSPSDIIPAKFTTNVQKPAQGTQVVRIPQDISERVAEPRISLEQILSRGCVLETREGVQYVDLVWQTANAAFVVQRNGQPYQIPGTKELMTIGKFEASTWHEGKYSTQVVLKGSAREGRSNGIILLYFVENAGMKACWDWLMVASSENMVTKVEDGERMDKMFRNLALNVQLDADKYATQARTKRMVDNVQSQHDLARQIKKQLPADDEIIYEQSDEGRKRQPSARSRMQGSVEQPSTQLQPSPYFSGESKPVPRKSTRQSKPVIERTPTPPPLPPRWTETHKLEPWHQPVMFPTTGARRTAVDFQDIERLDEGEFLNDNLVGYALRRIEEDMAPEHKSKVHFFNSYFFTSLTSKNGRKAFNYDAVKKWTKQKDLLSTPYIVVPINENLHWFVAIICNLPNLVRKPALLGDEAADVAETPATSQRSSVQPSPIRDPDDEEVPDSQDPEKPDEQAMRQLSLDESEKGRATSGEVFEFDENKNFVGIVSEPHRDVESTQKNGKQHDKKSKKRAAPSLRKYPTDKPTIITLDSFGVGHPGQVSTLKKYVEAEALDKRGMNAAAGAIQGMTATGMPTQSNYCDCGLYLVGYVEEFAKDPEAFVNKVLSRQLDEDSNFASFDPSAKRAELRDDLLKLHAEQDQARIALKKAKKEEKLKDKVGATAVTAQNSPTPAASKHPSPASAPPQSSTKPSSEAQSSLKTLPTASRMASEKLGHIQHDSGTQHESRPDPTVNAMESSIHGTRDAGDGSDDEGLDELPARPLSSGRSTGLSAVNARNSVPKQSASHAGSSAEDGDDGEMLDGLDGAADAKEEKNIMRDFAQGRNGHKVTSPEVDGLAHILSQGPPSAKKES